MLHSLKAFLINIEELLPGSGLDLNVFKGWSKPCLSEIFTKQ